MRPKKLSLLMWATILSAALLMFASTAAGQTQVALQISSPANGTVVNSGQTLTVSVTSPNGTAFSQIAVIGPDPIGFNFLATSAPAQFSIPIPADSDSRLYTLTADGIMVSGQGATSAPIRIDIERSDFPLSLFSTTSGLVLESQGEQSPLALLATFGDGSTVDVTASTLLSYSSSNSGVASVNPNGVVTAVGAGAAIITAKYTLNGQSLQIGIPVTLQRQLLSALPPSLSFGNQPIGTSSTPQQLTLTDAATRNVTIQAITPSGDFSETDNCIASSPLTPNNGCTVNVTFSPTASGTRTGTLSVANSANIVPVAVSLSGTGNASPYITSLSPTSGSVGTSVTITGVNFGTTQGSSTITFNGTASTPTNWSATSIVVLVPTGATTGNVVVTVGGAASNGVSFTVGVPTPSITSIDPGYGYGGTSVTITGTNFGATQGTSTVTFGGLASTPTSWSATSIVVPATGQSSMNDVVVNVVVTVGGVTSNAVQFTLCGRSSLSCSPTGP